MTLVEINTKLSDVKNQMQEVILLHEKSMKEFREKISNLERYKQLALDDFNMNKVALAESVMYVSHWYKGYGGEIKSFFNEGEAKKLWRDAIKMFCEDPKSYKSHYMCTKDYSGWTGQYVGTMPYGCGPKHGSTTFEIGLKTSLRGSNARDLTPEEIEACVYYLEKKAFMVRAKEANG